MPNDVEAAVVVAEVVVEDELVCGARQKNDDWFVCVSGVAAVAALLSCGCDAVVVVVVAGAASYAILEVHY